MFLKMMNVGSLDRNSIYDGVVIACPNILHFTSYSGTASVIMV